MVVRRGKHTKTKQRTTRSHHALKPKKLVKCSHCGALGMAHQVCLNCGYYKNRQVIDVLAKLEKKERKQKERELAEQEATAEKGLNAKELSKK